MGVDVIVVVDDAVTVVVVVAVSVVIAVVGIVVIIVVVAVIVAVDFVVEKNFEPPIFCHHRFYSSSNFCSSIRDQLTYLAFRLV